MSEYDCAFSLIILANIHAAVAYSATRHK